MKTLNKSRMGALIALLTFLAACQNETAVVVETPLPAVDVASVISQEITEWDEYTGRLEAPETVQLRPRVSGYIQEVMFDEGAMVQKDETLFRIDPAPFKAEVKRIQADLSQAKSRLKLAESEYERAEKLIAKRAISQEMAEGRYANMESAKAAVDSLAASLSLAQLQLDYTEVKAPIAGRVSRALITEGNFVQDGQSVLTSIVSTQEMFAYFDADERAYIKYVNLAKQGKRLSSRDHANPVVMALAGQDSFPFEGAMDFVDNQINLQTGTIRGRAVFDNSEGDLIPGMFVRLRLVGSASYDATLIDEKAIGTNLSKKFVLVVGNDGFANYREIELGDKIGDLRVVKSGLSSGDHIVVNGLQRVRPGTQVEPQIVAMADEQSLNEIARLQQNQAADLIERPLAAVAPSAAPGEKS